MTYEATNDNSNPQQGAPFHATPPPQQRRAFKVPPSKKDERKLFVGGLPGNITEVEFKEFFEQFGTLVDSVVMFDRETRRSRGFGFVTFEDPMVCRKLLMMGNEGADPDTAMSLIGRLEMQGKICEVKAATPKEGGVVRHRRDEQKRMGNYVGVPPALRFDGVPPPPPHGPPGMPYPYHPPAMPHGVYYPPPFIPPPLYAAPNGYMEYPHAPPVPPVSPVEYPHGNPQHAYPFPPIIGIPVMPYPMPVEHPVIQGNGDAKPQ